MARQPISATSPLAGQAEWRAVMDRAGYRCECRRCPGHRRQQGGRCETEHDAGHRLIAAPADPGPNPARTLPTHGGPDGLVAWCGPCFDRAAAAARKHLRAADRHDAADDPDTLF
jgi:hypothetical protein